MSWLLATLIALIALVVIESFFVEHSTLHVILRIVQSAYFKAILRGFESAPRTAPART